MVAECRSTLQGEAALFLSNDAARECVDPPRKRQVVAQQIVVAVQPHGLQPVDVVIAVRRGGVAAPAPVRTRAVDLTFTFPSGFPYTAFGGMVGEQAGRSERRKQVLIVLIKRQAGPRAPQLEGLLGPNIGAFQRIRHAQGLAVFRCHRSKPRVVHVRIVTAAGAHVDGAQLEPRPVAIGGVAVEAADGLELVPDVPDIKIVGNEGVRERASDPFKPPRVPFQ